MDNIWRWEFWRYSYY